MLTALVPPIEWHAMHCPMPSPTVPGVPKKMSLPLAASLPGAGVGVGSLRLCTHAVQSAGLSATIRNFIIACSKPQNSAHCP